MGTVPGCVAALGSAAYVAWCFPVSHGHDLHLSPMDSARPAIRHHVRLAIRVPLHHLHLRTYRRDGVCVSFLPKPWMGSTWVVCSCIPRDGQTWVQSFTRKGTRTKGPLAGMDRRGPKRRQQRETCCKGRWEVGESGAIPTRWMDWEWNKETKGKKKGFLSLVGAFKMILAPPHGCICLETVEWKGNCPLPIHGGANTMSTKQDSTQQHKPAKDPTNAHLFHSPLSRVGF